MDVERRNILCVLERSITKLQGLLSAQHQAVIIFDDENEQPDSPTSGILSQLLNILECGLCHGLVCSRLPSQDTKSFYLTAFSNAGCVVVGDIDPWPVIYRATSHFAGGWSLIKDVDEIDGVKSGLGKARLWLRKALMSKNLAYLLRCLIEYKDEQTVPPKMPPTVSNQKENVGDPENDCISRFYANGSLLTSSEGQQFVGTLEELDAIDFCFPIKENLTRFDEPLHPIDYEACFRAFSSESPAATDIPLSDLESQLTSVTEQKKYLEAALSTTQSRLELSMEKRKSLAATLQTTLARNNELETEKAALAARIKSLEEENNRLMSYVVRQSKAVNKDLQTVRETFQLSTSNLDSRNAELEALLSAESKRRAEAEVALAEEKSHGESQEAELKSLRSLNAEKQQCLEEHRLQNESLVLLNREFSNRVNVLTEELEKSQKTVFQLQQKADGMNTVLTLMEERFASICEDKTNLEKSIVDLNRKLMASENRCIDLEAELLLSRELAQDLQTKVNQANQISSELEYAKTQLEDSAGTASAQQKEIVELSSRCSSQEASLTEMAQKVESAKLEAERLRERLQALSMAEWKSDADAGVCTQCTAPFGLSRRKHHCRNCGLIFCYECSAYRMTLPSSSKPLRVCEPCHNQLLERYSTASK